MFLLKKLGVLCCVLGNKVRSHSVFFFSSNLSSLNICKYFKYLHCLHSSLLASCCCFIVIVMSLVVLLPPTVCNCKSYWLCSVSMFLSDDTKPYVYYKSFIRHLKATNNTGVKKKILQVTSNYYSIMNYETTKSLNLFYAFHIKWMYRAKTQSTF